MIRLETLGRVPLAGQPKRTAVLSYLALARPRGDHRRDVVLALLWPELDADRGRSALRQALFALRRDLGPSVVSSIGTESIAVNQSAVSCDVWDLESAAESGNHERVLELYGGELLAGLFVSDAPNFEQWLDGERLRLRELVRASAWAVAEAALLAGNQSRVISATRAALALSTFDETAIRRAMQLFASTGERAAAIALYENFASEMRRELDVEPSSQTQAVAHELRRASIEVVQRPAGLTTLAPAAARVAPVRPRRNVRVAVAALTTIVAITAATRIAGSVSTTTDPRRIRVEPFENYKSAELATTATNRLRDALLAVGDVRIASGDVDDGRAGTIVRGSVRATGDSVVLRGEVVDRASGTILRSLTIAGTNADSVTARFADGLHAIVAASLYPGWGTALSQPVSYAGYRLFVDGLRSVRREQHDSAIVAFRRAFADSTFTAAGLLAASELFHLKRFSSADSIVSAIAPRRVDLAPIDARLLEWIERLLRGDRAGALASIRGVVDLAPAANLARLELAIESIGVGRPGDALDALSHIDRDSAYADDWPSYWATYAEALHVAGDHERELAKIREGLRRHPETRVLENYEVRALAALGRVDEVERRLAVLSSGPLVGGVDADVTSRQVALELSTHGHADDARRLLARLVRSSDTRRPPTDSAALLGYRLSRARTLFLADDRARARAIYDSLLHEYPRCLDCVGALGILAGRDGNRSVAIDAATRLGASTAPHLYGRQHLWRARIFAAVGDIGEAERALVDARNAGAGYDVLTHTDPELRRVVSRPALSASAR